MRNPASKTGQRAASQTPRSDGIQQTLLFLILKQLETSLHGTDTHQDSLK